MISTRITEDQFVERLLLLTQEEGKPFITAIYSLLDELTAEEIAENGIQFACRKGCSFCCKQMVVSTELEWQAIKEYILAGMPFRERNQLFRRAKKMLPEWRRWLARNHARSTRDPMLVYKAWLSKPCVFLSDLGECSIYPVRNIDCRSVASDSVCTSLTLGGSMHRFAFPWHLWANNLILDEQAARSIQMGVTPLIHWLDLLLTKMGKT